MFRKKKSEIKCPHCKRKISINPEDYMVEISLSITSPIEVHYEYFCEHCSEPFWASASYSFNKIVNIEK